MEDFKELISLFIFIFIFIINLMNKSNFLNHEGNNFLKRNIESFNNNNYIDNDIIINNLTNLNNLNILEIGCSNGWRLNKLNELYPNNNYYGLNPSKEEIIFGKNNYNNITLKY